MYVLQEKTTKKILNMAYAKLFLGLLDFFGISTIILGIISNMDNLKSVVLFILGSIYAMIRVYYTLVERSQKRRDKEYDLWNKEQDKIERLEKYRENHQN